MKKIKSQELMERLNTEFAEFAPEATQVLNVIEHWPLTVEDVEISPSSAKIQRCTETH